MLWLCSSGDQAQDFVYSVTLPAEPHTLPFLKVSEENECPGAAKLQGLLPAERRRRQDSTWPSPWLPSAQPSPFPSSRLVFHSREFKTRASRKAGWVGYADDSRKAGWVGMRVTPGKQAGRGAGDSEGQSVNGSASSGQPPGSHLWPKGLKQGPGNKGWGQGSSKEAKLVTVPQKLLPRGTI